jgi:hypothetical protein
VDLDEKHLRRERTRVVDDIAPSQVEQPGDLVKHRDDVGFRVFLLHFLSHILDLLLVTLTYGLLSVSGPDPALKKRWPTGEFDV